MEVCWGGGVCRRCGEGRKIPAWRTSGGGGGGSRCGCVFNISEDNGDRLEIAWGALFLDNFIRNIHNRE